MAHTVDFELPRENRGRPARYPWKEWLDGRVWLITPDDHEGISTAGFRHQAHVAAKRNGTTISTRIVDEGIYIRAWRDDDNG